MRSIRVNFSFPGTGGGSDFRIDHIIVEGQEKSLFQTGELSEKSSFLCTD